jgi:penicillin amidase
MKKILLLLIAIVINSYALDTLKVIAPSGGEVNIYRDDFGVPHIYADNEADAFFGQGFATAHDRLVQLHVFRINAAGKLAEWGFLYNNDINNLIISDVETRSVQYTEEELIEQFEQMPAVMQTMINSYTEGINSYIDSMHANTAKYMDYTYFQLTQYGVEIPKWTNINTMEVIVWISRIFGQFGGNELENYQRFMDMGEESFNEAYPINDPDMFSTLKGELPGNIERNYKPRDFDIPVEFGQILKERKEKSQKFREEQNIPNKFGSFAALIPPSKTIDNSGMLLGCPQMGTPTPSDVTLLNEVELNCPDLHIGGAAVTGIPGIIIGRNENMAWTFTSGTMDNTDIVLEQLTDDFSQYEYESEFFDFEVIYDTIVSVDATLQIKNTPVEYRRTLHGPVLGLDFASQTAIVNQYAFWQKEFKTWVSLYNIFKAASKEEIEEAASECTISFNMFYMTKEREAYFHFLGIYPYRNFGVDPRLPRIGDGTEEWTEFWAFEDLPHGSFDDQEYFVNWNNKPAPEWDQGDNLRWISGNTIDQKSKSLDAYVEPFSDMTYQDLKDAPKAVNDHGTYQQAFAFLEDGNVIDENILPPGQSAFVDMNGVASPHFNDQWDIFIDWEYKAMIFGEEAFVSVDYDFNSQKFVKLMPNPAISSVRIVYNSENSAMAKVEIRDIMGKPIVTLFDGIVRKGENEYIWNINNSVTRGVYFYTIIQNDKKLTGKIIIQ